MRTLSSNFVRLLFVLPFLGIFGCVSAPLGTDRPQYHSNPFVISLDIPTPKDDKGGVIVADLNDNGLMDYVVTVPGHDNYFLNLQPA